MHICDGCWLELQFCVSSGIVGSSVYVRNLPYSITLAKLNNEFKIFGPLKVGGGCLRNHQVECASPLRPFTSNNDETSPSASPSQLHAKNSERQHNYS